MKENYQLLRHPLVLALAFALASPSIAMAQTEQESEESNETSETSTLDRIVVTGSRIGRAEVEGPAPVTVITSADIERQGFSTVYDALRTVTQFTGDVQNELNQSGFTPNASFLNLRGLGPGYQLVLINGRRAADYPMPYNSQSNAVNLANIPGAAIDRIEILATGASAIYGSDAVAGVVNVILKTNYDGDVLTLRGGTTTRGGGDTGRLQWIGGKARDRWSVTYAFEFLEREAIYASQRDFMDSYRDDPSLTDPSLAVPVEGVRFTVNRGAGAIREWPDGADATCARFSDFEPFRTSAAQPANNACGYFGYPATQAIRNSDSNQSAYLYGTFDVTDATQAWAQFNYTRSEATLASATRFVQSGASIGVANFYDPNLGGRVGNILRIFTPNEVGSQGAESTNFEASYDVAIGLRGSFLDGRFDWDATLSHARYKMREEYSWLLRDKVRDYFFGPNLGTAPNGLPIYELQVDRLLNPMAPGVIQSLSSQFRSDADSQVTQASFVLSGDLFELPAGPLAMAATLEGASQEYAVNPDHRLALDYTGNEVPLGRTATGGGGERDRYAVGLEFNIPIFSTLTASLAGRYDKYDDETAVDDAMTWSAGLEFRPFSNLLLRGTHSTSFRAPDMHYVYAEPSGFYTSVLDEYRCRRDGRDPTAPGSAENACTSADGYIYQVFGVRQGSKELQEEEGKSTTIGFVWDVTDDISINADWYKIRLEGGVNDITRSYLLRNEAACRLGTDRDGTPVNSSSAECQYFMSLVSRDGINPDLGQDEGINQIESVPFNQAMMETSGIDARVRYRLDTDRLGNFNFGLGWTHVLDLDFQEFPGSDIQDRRDHRQFFNFRSRVNWEANWRKDDWAVGLYGYRWGSLPNWAEDARIGSYVIWNATVQKVITDKITVGLYANNVFDKINPEDDTYNSYPYFWRSYSPIGREVFVQLDYKFN